MGKLVCPCYRDTSTRKGLFLAGSLADAEAVLPGRPGFRITVGDVPTDASVFGESEFWDACFSVIAHRSILVYDAVE